VGDFRINIHDRFSVQQDPLDQPTVGGVVDFTRFTNMAGVSVLWDLNDVKLTLGYDYFIYISLADEFSYLDRRAHALSFSAAFLVRETLTLGVEGGAARSRYDEDFLADADTYHAGAFVDTMLTDHIRLRVAAGWQGMSHSGGAAGFESGDGNGWYANMNLVHKISPVAMQTVVIGHESSLGVFANVQKSTFVQHTVSWDIIYDLTLQTDLRYERGEESGGPYTETFNRYGASVALSYPITEKLRASLRYRFLYKDSDLEDRDYRQNQVMLDLNYVF
jgi:hypothetical protein